MARKVAEKTYPIAVETDTYRDVIRHAKCSQWDADDVSYNTTVKGIRVAGSKQHHEFTVPFEPVPGVTYYLVVVTYNTGDSFHREDGCTEFVSMWTTSAGADRAAQAILEHYRTFRENKVSYSYKIELEGAREPAELFATWCGYFERMTSVEVVPVQLGGIKYTP